MPDPEPPSDNDLDGYDSADLLELAACYDGTDPMCRAAFEALYDRHMPRLRRNLATFDDLLGGASRTDDAVQDAFEIALRKAHTFTKDPGESRDLVEKKVAAWLTKIAKNAILDRVRREPKVVHRPRAVMAATAARGTTATVTESDRLPPTPEADRLLECLDALSKMQRRALLLVYNYVDPAAGQIRLPNGASDEIAEILGTTKANLRQIRSRAERALKACCDGTTSP